VGTAAALVLPSYQVHLNLCLHSSSGAEAKVEEAAEWDKQQRVLLKLEVGRKGHVHMQLRASQFPKLKQWSEWQKDFVLSMAERFGSGRGRGRGRTRARKELEELKSQRPSKNPQMKKWNRECVPSILGKQGKNEGAKTRSSQIWA